jgi:CheY-like chemotaxis protein
MSNLRLTILIADDKPEVVDAIALDIETLAKKYNKRIRILKAISGSEVIEIARSEHIDAFFIDYMFEYGITGDEIIQDINDPFGIKLIILMSSWKEDILEPIITKNHFRLKSRFGFLRKPYDPLTLQTIFLDMINFFESRTYPHPIQYVYDAVQNSQDGATKSLAIKDFYETLIKFSISILMPTLDRQINLSSFKVSFDIKKNLTFGTWLSWLISLLDFYKETAETPFVAEIISFYEVNNRETIHILNKFKRVRDDELGHGYVKDNEWYKIMASDFIKSVNSIYRELQFLSKFILIFPEKTEILPGEANGFIYQVIALMGNEMVPSKADLYTNLRLARNSIYLYTPSDKAISLSPLVTYKMCQECRSMRFYFLDRIQNNTIIYNPFCNHRIEDNEAKKQFDIKYQSFFVTH